MHTYLEVKINKHKTKYVMKVQLAENAHEDLT